MDHRFAELGTRAELFRDIRFHPQGLALAKGQEISIKPLPHIAVSVIISTAVGFYFRSIGCAVISFTCGVLIDLDHFIDYYLNYKFTFKIRDIYDACCKVTFKKLYLLLHSYEFIALLWIAIYFLSLSDLWKAAAIGFTQHILLDQVSNIINPCGYFLIYRIIKRFDKKELVRKIKE